MKKSFSYIGIASALIFAAFSGMAQSPGIYTLGTFGAGGTNNVATAVTNTTYTANTLAVSEFSTVGIQISCKGSGAATDVVVFKFAQSLDSTSYETVPSKSVSVTLAGTATVTAVAEVTVPIGGTLRLASIENPAAVYVTNIVIKARFKAPKVTTR